MTRMPAGPGRDARRPEPAVLAALLCLAGSLAVSRPARAWSQGPPADRVGLCNARATCNDIGCHNDYPLNAGSALSTLRLESGPLPSAYKVGELLDFVLEVTDPDTTRQRFGFQIGVVSDCPFAAQAGTVTPLEPARTQMVAGTGGLEFLEHFCFPPGDPATCGYLPPGPPGANSWRFQWQAPAALVGPVTFYWAINSANGDAASTDDFIALGEATLDPSCPDRVDSLRAVKGACDPGAPGVLKVDLSWTAVAYASGYRIYRTADPTELPDPGLAGAPVVPLPCDEPPAGPAIHYYTVIGLCADGSDGPS